MGEQQQSSASRQSFSVLRLMVWAGFAALLLMVIVFRSKISEFRLDGAGANSKMAAAGDPKKLSPEERKAASDDLARRVSALEAQARSSTQNAAGENKPDTAPANEAAYQQEVQPQPASIPNIAGTWSSPIGLMYQVTQYGNYVLISEINQGVVEAAAAGLISGPSFSLPAQTMLNTTGVLSLTVAADQRHMTGQYRDNMTGQVVTISLSR